MQQMQQHSIQTTFLGGPAQAGCMFDVAAKRDITITEFDVHTTSNIAIDIEVWTKEGPLRGYENDPTHWIMMGCGEVLGRGYSRPTNVPHDMLSLIAIAQDATHAIYTTFVQPNGAFMQYTPSENGLSTGGVYVENDDLEVIVGVGKSYYFGLGTYYDRMWNGDIRYVLDFSDRLVPLNVSNCRPSAAPSLAPSGAAMRSEAPTIIPSNLQSVHPSAAPSIVPSVYYYPSSIPSSYPSFDPTIRRHPSNAPSNGPTVTPSLPASNLPSIFTSVLPSASPSWYPSQYPSAFPSIEPSTSPSWISTDIPSYVPSITPSATPSYIPSAKPSHGPTLLLRSRSPSWKPSDAPSIFSDVLHSSFMPSFSSPHPSELPSRIPSLVPSVTVTQDLIPSTPTEHQGPTLDRPIPGSTTSSSSSSVVDVEASTLLAATISAAAAAASSSAAGSATAAASASAKSTVSAPAAGATGEYPKNDTRQLKRYMNKADPDYFDLDMVEAEAETENDDKRRRRGSLHSKRQSTQIMSRFPPHYYKGGMAEKSSFFSSELMRHNEHTLDYNIFNEWLFGNGDSLRRFASLTTEEIRQAVDVQYLELGLSSMLSSTSRYANDDSSNDDQYQPAQVIRIIGGIRIIPVHLPSYFQNAKSVKIIAWLKTEGQFVRIGEVLAIITDDESSSVGGMRYVLSPSNGFLGGVMTEERSVCDVGSLVAFMMEGTEDLTRLKNMVKERLARRGTDVASRTHINSQRSVRFVDGNSNCHHGYNLQCAYSNGGDDNDDDDHSVDRSYALLG